MEFTPVYLFFSALMRYHWLYRSCTDTRSGRNLSPNENVLSRIQNGYYIKLCGISSRKFIIHEATQIREYIM